MLRFTIRSRTLRFGLLGIAALAIAASAIAVTMDVLTGSDDSVLGSFSRFAGFWLNVNNERNLTAWYSSILLAIVALVASDIARVERSQRRTPWWCWVFLSATFVYLSLDELLQMHEKSSIVSALLVPLVIVFGAATLPLLWKLPRRIALQFVAAGVLFVGGAAGIDSIDRFLGETNLVIVHLEEACEMFGVAIMLAAIAQYREVLDDHIAAAAPEVEQQRLPS
jgi:hypothetical protein